MAYTALTTAETDANSPFNATLTTKIKDNFDAHESGKASCKIIYGAAANDAISIDSSIDWRDRYILVSGLVVIRETLADAERYNPGGSQDATLQTNEAPTANQDYGVWKGEMFYSEAGMAAWNSGIARLVKTSNDAQTWAIYVDSTTGALMLKTTGADSNHDNTAWNFIVIYSADQGVV